MAHQQFQGLEERDAGLQQCEQFLVEEDQGLGLELAPAAESRVRAGDLQGKSALREDPGAAQRKAETARENASGARKGKRL